MRLAWPRWSLAPTQRRHSRAVVKLQSSIVPCGRLAQWDTCFRGCAQMLGWSRSWREEPRTAGCPPERRPQGHCCSASLLRRRLSPRFGSPQSVGGARPHRKRRMSPSMCCTRTRPTWRSATGLHVTRGALTHAKIRWSANTHRRSNSAAGTAGSFAGCGACWSACKARIRTSDVWFALIPWCLANACKSTRLRLATD